jgi:hypothetical protein
MAFTLSSNTAEATPQGGARAYPGTNPQLVAGDAIIDASTGDLYNETDANTYGQGEFLLGVRFGYHPAGQSQQVLYTATQLLDTTPDIGPQAFNARIPGLINGTMYSVFAQGVY